jgi:hypothetical protein
MINVFSEYEFNNTLSTHTEYSGETIPRSMNLMALKYHAHYKNAVLTSSNGLCTLPSWRRMIFFSLGVLLPSP